MYTTETSARSDSSVAQRQPSPHINRYLVPGLSLEVGIFKEQQTTFVVHLVLHDLALQEVCPHVVLVLVDHQCLWTMDSLGRYL